MCRRRERYTALALSAGDGDSRGTAARKRGSSLPELFDLNGCGVPEVPGIRTPRSSWSLLARDLLAETAVTCSRDDTRRAYVLSRA